MVSGLRKSGEFFPAEASISKIDLDDLGTRPLFTVVLRDITARIDAEKALQQAKENLFGLIQSVPLAIAAFDLDGVVNVWNPAAEAIFGWPAEGVIGNPCPIVPVDLRYELERLTQSAKAGQSLTGLATECVRKDGTRVPVSLSTAPCRGATGEIRGVLVLLEDVSERRKADEAQQRLTTILEATPDMVFTTDSDGRLLYLNGAGRKMLGVENKNVDRLTITDLHPDSAANFLLHVAIPTALRDGSWSGESRVIDRSKNEIPVSQVIIAHKTPAGAIKYLSTIIRDITDRKRAEETQHFLLEASRNLAGSIDRDAVLQSLVSLIVPRYADYCIVDLITADGRVQRAAMLHANSSKQSVLEQLRAFPAADGRTIGLVRVLRTGEPELVSQVTDVWLRAVTQDDNELSVLHALAPVSEVIVSLPARGRVLGAMTLAYSESGRAYGPEDLPILADLAGRAAIAIDNAQLHAETQQAVCTRDEVLRIVAHDLRNPLSRIMLSAQLLRNSLPPAEDTTEQDNHLQVIRRAVESANTLIDDLLDVARMQSGALSVNPEEQEVVPLVQEAVDTHRPLAGTKAVVIDIMLPRELPMAVVDRKRLLQVFANLIGNAIKFAPSGSRIAVCAEVMDREILFSITDQGPGIPRNQIACVFQPFWQATAHRRGGAGLGLAISKGIVEAHGGRIWAESEPEVKTTLYFTIPRTANEYRRAPYAA